MRPLVAVLTAVTVALGAACSGDEVEDSLDAAVEEVSEAGSEVGDAVTDAASEVADTAEEVTELVGFCTAAYRTQDAVEDRDPEEALEAAEDLAAEAPDEVRPEAETVLDGARAYQGGDDEALEDEGFRTAATEVAEYAEAHCDPRS